MIQCRECIDFLSDYLDGYLKEETVKKLEAHLSECLPCSEFLHSFKSTVFLTQELKDEAVPDTVMLKVRSFIRQQLGANPGEENAPS